MGCFTINQSMFQSQTHILCYCETLRYINNLFVPRALLHSLSRFADGHVRGRRATPCLWSGAGCGTSRVLSRQYVRDQRWTAETTELGGVEGQWLARRGGGDYRGAHAPITGTPAAHRARPHVPRRHGAFSQSQRDLNPPSSKS